MSGTVLLSSEGNLYVVCQEQSHGSWKEKKKTEKSEITIIKNLSENGSFKYMEVPVMLQP